jgi:hypothetical protein
LQYVRHPPSIRSYSQFLTRGPHHTAITRGKNIEARKFQRRYRTAECAEKAIVLVVFVGGGGGVVGIVVCCVSISSPLESSSTEVSLYGDNCKPLAMMSTLASKTTLTMSAYGSTRKSEEGNIANKEGRSPSRIVKQYSSTRCTPHQLYVEAEFCKGVGRKRLAQQRGERVYSPQRLDSRRRAPETKQSPRPTDVANLIYFYRTDIVFSTVKEVYRKC